MKNYNYLEAIKADIKQYLEDEFSYRYADLTKEELEEQLYEDLFVNDDITGNASGSYTFNREEAKEYVIDNMDLCIESLKEFCVDAETVANKFLNNDWEYFDVTIRCCLLGQAISEVLEEQ